MSTDADLDNHNCNRSGVDDLKSALQPSPIYRMEADPPLRADDGEMAVDQPIESE